MNISRNHNKGPKHKHWDLTSKPVLEPDEMTASKIHTKGPQSLTNLSPALTTSEAAPHGALDQGRGCKGKVEVTKGLISSFHSEFITANVKKKPRKNMLGVIELSKAAVEDSSTQCTREGRVAPSLNYPVCL